MNNFNTTIVRFKPFTEEYKNKIKQHFNTTIVRFKLLLF